MSRMMTGTSILSLRSFPAPMSSQQRCRRPVRSRTRSPRKTTGKTVTGEFSPEMRARFTSKMTERVTGRSPPRGLTEGEACKVNPARCARAATSSPHCPPRSSLNTLWIRTKPPRLPLSHSLPPSSLIHTNTPRAHTARTRCRYFYGTPAESLAETHRVWLKRIMKQTKRNAPEWGSQHLLEWKHLTSVFKMLSTAAAFFTCLRFKILLWSSGKLRNQLIYLKSRLPDMFFTWQINTGNCLALSNIHKSTFSFMGSNM